MSEERIPRLVEGADARAHEIDAKDGFVHSCIDGVLNVDDIADVTVLSVDEVVEILEKLVLLDVVEWVEPKASSAPPVVEARREGIQLSDEAQERILEAFQRADKLNHYERLGVPIGAERSEIRKAYFSLSKMFHPDAHYGKELGDFQSKMEVVFRKITDSYEAIGRPKKREAYDRYLQQQRVVNTAEQQMDRVEQRAQAMSRALSKAPVAERQAATVPPSSRWMPSEVPDAIPIRESAAPVQVIAPGTPEHARMQRKRELLERRLMGRAKPAKKPGRSIPAPTAKVGKKAALRDLTRSLKHTAAITGGVDRSQRHIENARVAEADGDMAAAAISLRMALALDSSSEQLQEQYRRVNSNLRVELLDIHRQQAKYEEENSLWAAASISWSKVAEAAPDDAEAPRRAAKTLVAAGGDLRKARDFAQRSLELMPDSVDTRVLLARIYIDAGMDNSAAKELDEAAKLDPGHEMVKNLRKQLGG